MTIWGCHTYILSSIMGKWANVTHLKYFADNYTQPYSLTRRKFGTRERTTLCCSMPDSFLIGVSWQYFQIKHLLSRHPAVGDKNTLHFNGFMAITFSQFGISEAWQTDRQTDKNTELFRAQAAWEVRALATMFIMVEGDLYYFCTMITFGSDM